MIKYVYATVDKEHTAVVFSKEMANKYLSFYPTAKFETFSDIHLAIEKAKPADYNSTKIFTIKTGHIKGFCFTSEEFNTLIRGIKNNDGKKINGLNKAFRYIYSSKIPKTICSDADVIIPAIQTNATNKKIKTSSSRTANVKNLAYVDGSFFNNNNLMGIAYTIQNANTKFSHSSFIKVDKDGSSIKAELISAMMAVDRAIQEGLSEITIVHDNEQIAKLLDTASHKDTFNKKYYNFITAASNVIDITFKKVKSHSGDVGNNAVDKLARHSNVDKFINML